MSQLHKRISRIFRSRRGSVLILVVSLLVMLAMMGTAYMATARIDREQSQLAEVKVSLVDPLVDQIADDVKETLANDIVVGGALRPVAVAAYKHYTDPTTQVWLADRMPKAATPGRPFWRYVSNTQGATALTNIALGSTYSGGPAYVASVPWDRATQGLAPTSMRIDYRIASAGTVDRTPAVFPAFVVCDPITGAPDVNGSNVVIAADADGDGIADSLLYPVPGIPSDGGVTYYAAVRIIDNSSAINATLAGSRESDFDFADGKVDALGNAVTTGTNMGLFPSHIGLLEILEPGTAATEFAAFRSNRRALKPAGGLNIAYSDTGTARADFQFVNQGDGLFMQLGRRINAAGRLSAGPISTSTYRSAVADAGYLAYRFGMVDPTQNSNPFMSYLSAPAGIERTIPNSVYFPAINWVRKSTNPLLPAFDNHWSQYPANQIAYWFDCSFNHERLTLPFTAVAGDMGSTPASPLGYRNIRPLLVTSNAVSNAIQKHEPLPAGMPAYSTTQNPTKVSVNTADFGTLWRGFWNVMCDDATPANPATRDRMFRFPVGGSVLTSDNEMLLVRSALAAVNAIDLRDHDDIPTFATITIGAKTVTVFGTEAQPYMVGASVNATRDIRILLYNPTTKTITNPGLQFQKGTGTLTPISGVSIPASLAPGITTVTIPATENVVPSSGAGDRVYLTSLATSYPAATTDRAPIDMIDFTSAAAAMYYRRNDGANGAKAWHCVTPGLFTFAADPAGTNTGATIAAADFEVQIANENFGGPNKAITGSSGTPNKFPFGGFARDGDMLQITFIGSYRAESGGTREHFPVTQDLTWADDEDGSDNTFEQVGRFCPLYALDPASTLGYYKFAERLFDYFTTIHNQNDDYAPNVDKNFYSTAPLGNPVPEAIANEGGAAPPPGTEDTSSVAEGKINVNTASWQALASLPLLPHTGVDTTPVNGFQDDIETLAKAIVTYRETNGPFENLFQLNKVLGTPGFQNATVAPAGNPTIADGDFANGTTEDNVSGDFEARCLTITRLSNLLTTRSDSFTVYVVVQAWENVGTAYPVLVAQSRKGFIMDRTRVTPASMTKGVLSTPFSN